MSHWYPYAMDTQRIKYYFKRTPYPQCYLRLTSRYVTKQMYAQNNITCSSVSLSNFRANRTINKLDGKNIICVRMLIFYDYSVFLVTNEHF